MSLYGAALQSLRYNPNAKGPEETKFGYVIYDGSPVDYHHWRYRTQLKVDASNKDDMKKTIIRLIDQLRLLDQDMIRLQEKVNTVLEMKENERKKDKQPPK